MFLLEGLLIGLATLFIIGPVVFILINATLQNGKNAGFGVALGIFISDLIYALLISVNGINSLLNNTFLNKYLSLIGFTILFIFGLTYTFKKKQEITEYRISNSKPIIKSFLKGFSVNFFNPFVLSFWVLLAKYGMDKYDNHANYFLISIVVGVLLIDIVKVFLSSKLNSILHSNKLFLVYKISGVIMVLFSFRILYAYLLK